MIKVRLTASLGLLLLFGCTTTATMIPVEGPLTEMRPVPVFEVLVEGVAGNSGRLSFSMANGTKCSGRWASAAGSRVSYQSTSLIGTYGTAYLSGYSVSPGKGQNPGQALLTCGDGRIIEVEFVTGAGTANGFGIGKDNVGNIYRMVF